LRQFSRGLGLSAGRSVGRVDCQKRITLGTGGRGGGEKKPSPLIIPPHPVPIIGLAGLGQSREKNQNGGHWHLRGIHACSGKGAAAAVAMTTPTHRMAAAHSKYGHYHTPLRPGSNFWPNICGHFFKYSFNGATSVPVIKRQRDSATYFRSRRISKFLFQSIVKTISAGNIGAVGGAMFGGFISLHSPGLLGSGLRRGCIRPLGTSQIERLRVIIAIVHQLLFEARSAN
jgi:hypothetical protein